MPPQPTAIEPEAFLSVHTGKQVLVADSSQVIRTSAAMVLEPTGIGVIEAENQMLAARALSENPIDLILLDCDFDSSDGHQFMEKIRGDPATRDIPAILLAGLERRDSVDNSSVNSVLIKPFESQELIDQVEQALTNSKPVCPTCNHPVEGPGKTCPACRSLHHTECWKLFDGCGKCQAGR